MWHVTYDMDIKALRSAKGFEVRSNILYGTKLLREFFHHFCHFRLFFKNSGLFRTVVSNLIYRKIFGKFCKTFGGPKPLFIFEKFSTVERPGKLKDRESRKTGKVERPGKSKDRESWKAENFRPTHCLTGLCLAKLIAPNIFIIISITLIFLHP